MFKCFPDGTEKFNQKIQIYIVACRDTNVSFIPDAAMVNAAAEVGRNLGLAFQIIDDVLDYESSAKDLGKPTTNDLRQGLATCPVLFAAEEYPELNTLIDRRFSHSGDDALAYEVC